MFTSFAGHSVLVLFQVPYPKIKKKIYKLSGHLHAALWL